MDALKGLLPQGGKLNTNGGYHEVSEPIKNYVVQQGGLNEKEIELGDLGSDVFFDEVAAVRDQIRAYEQLVTQVSTKQVYSLSNRSPDLSLQLDSLTLQLSSLSNSCTKRISALGVQVGRDEARRSHFDNLKSALQRAVSKYQAVEMTQRERVKERVARQFRIVKPDATEFEVKEVLESGNGGQIFMMAVSNSRVEGAQAALTEAKTRRQEFAKIEATLVELGLIFAEVNALVVQQDAQFTTIENNAAATTLDLEKGVGQVHTAIVTAKATRKKRMICGGVLGVILLIIIIVIATSVGGGGDSEENKTKTVTDSTATDSKTASDATKTGTETAATAPTAWWTPPATNWQGVTTAV